MSDEPAADPAGAVAGFADATGRFLPLVCTANAGLMLAATAIMTGTESGLATSNATPENLTRAAVEGVLGSLADAADLLARYGVGFRRALLIGGGARSPAIRKLAQGIFGGDVDVPQPAEYVALGAARQAAWALAGTPDPPDWPQPSAVHFTGEPQPEVRSRYAALRDATAGWDDL